MILKMIRQSALVLILFSTWFFTSCTRDKTRVDVSTIEIKTSLFRFEKALFAKKDSLTENDILELRKEFPTFFDLYCRKIIHLPAPNDAMLCIALNGFLHDNDVQNIYKKTSETFTDADVKKTEDGLISFFKYLKYYFPKKPVLQIITYVSALNYNVVTTDSALALGIDMYLGKDCPFYSSLGFPQYMYKKFSKEYLVNDCIKGWFQSEYDPDAVKKELLSQMIYNGKLLYFTDAMAPDMPDSIKIGYTAEQLKWSEQNEAQMWAFLIEHKMLYNTRELEYMRYIEDGNTTSGFPKGAPGKTGCWLGWQIIKSYMKNNDVSLQQLLAENDAQKILDSSKYKPRK
jgi:hypothetical protein